MKRSLSFILVLSVMVLVCTMAMQAQPIITNGNFGNNSVGVGGYGYPYSPDPAHSGVTAAGWTFTVTLYNGSGVQSNGSAWGFANAPNGSQYSAFLQGTSSISQTVAGFNPGTYYTLSFYLSARPGNSVDNVAVSLGGTPLFTSITPGPGWTLYTDTFTATSSSELLQFSGITPGNPPPGAVDVDAGLANVGVKVPEPAMAMLLPFGLLFVSGIRKRFLA